MSLVTKNSWNNELSSESFKPPSKLLSNPVVFFVAKKSFEKHKRIAAIKRSIIHTRESLPWVTHRENNCFYFGDLSDWEVFFHDHPPEALWIRRRFTDASSRNAKNEKLNSIIVEICLNNRNKARFDRMFR